MSNTKFSYIHDPKNKYRIMTIARMVEDDTIYFGYSINRSVDKADRFYSNSGHCGSTVREHPVDQFSKKLGRTIAEGRCSRNTGFVDGLSTFIEQVEGEAPHITVLKHLVKSENQLVRRMCKHYLTEGYKKFAVTQDVRFG